MAAKLSKASSILKELIKLLVYLKNEIHPFQHYLSQIVTMKR